MAARKALHQKLLTTGLRVRTSAAWPWIGQKHTIDAGDADPKHNFIAVISFPIPWEAQKSLLT